MKGKIRSRLTHEKGETEWAKLFCILENMGAFRFIWVGVKDESLVGRNDPRLAEMDGILTRQKPHESRRMDHRECTVWTFLCP